MAIDILLRPVIESDVDEFFAHRQARGEVGPLDYVGFVNGWRERISNESVRIRTVIVAAQVVGYVAQFSRAGNSEVSYELGPQYWGKGFATAALRQFVADIDVQPLYARVAKRNVRSIRVLQKSGFSSVGEDKFVAAGGHEIEEFVFLLGAT